MTSSFSYFTGIDVSKDKVDIFSTEKSSHVTVRNSKKQIREALYHFDREHTLIVLENTGGYENVCVDTLKKIGYKIHRANNNKVKHFIKYQGVKAKTDKVDAKALADYGKFTYYNPSKGNQINIYEKPTEVQEKARQLLFFSDNLKRLRAAMKNRIQSPNCEAVKNIAKNVANYLDEQLKELDRIIDQEVKGTEISDKCELLAKYKGVGKTTAKELAVFLPELGKINHRAIASLAGLAPHPKDSGKIKGHRSTKGNGRPIIRRIMFMAALSAVRYNKNLSNFYEKKLKDGKPKMIAMTACMRKMLIQLNAISKKGILDF